MKFKVRQSKSSLSTDKGPSIVSHSLEDTDFKIMVNKSGVFFKGTSSPIITRNDLDDFALELSKAWNSFEIYFKKKIVSG